MVAEATTAYDLSNPIINSPYEPPQSHFEIGPKGCCGRSAAHPPGIDLSHRPAVSVGPGGRPSR